jgi:hypothetical protein
MAGNFILMFMGGLGSVINPIDSTFSTYFIPQEETQVYQLSQETDIKEFDTHASEFFKEIFQRPEKYRAVSFKNMWQGRNPDQEQLFLSNFFETQTLKYLETLPAKLFQRYIYSLCHDYSALPMKFSFLDPKIFKKSFLKTNDNELKKVFMQNMDYKAFAEKESRAGRLNPFYQWNNVRDYKYITSFYKGSLSTKSLYQRYHAQLEAFFNTIIPCEVSFNRASFCWTVRRNEYNWIPSFIQSKDTQETDSLSLSRSDSDDNLKIFYPEQWNMDGY